jgi:fatty acid desaturase
MIPESVVYRMRHQHATQALSVDRRLSAMTDWEPPPRWRGLVVFAAIFGLMLLLWMVFALVVSVIWWCVGS